MRPTQPQRKEGTCPTERMWSSLNEWLWQDRFWLPANNSWADLEDRDGLVYPHPRDMLMALPLALVLLAVRFTFERFVGLPLSRWLGLRSQTRRLVKPIAALEKHFLTEGQRPTETLKLALYHWYLMELSFYISLLITLPFDIKRKDFKEQVVHHFITITLIVFSYSANLLRIGSLVLLLHDSSDFLLEACKLFNYTHWRRTCDTLFIIFSLVFFYTRLVLFPTEIIYTTYYESIANLEPFFSYYFFNTLLMLLQLLHVFWSCLILRMIYSFMKKGQMEKDVRSDVEESDSSDGEAAPEVPRLKNGAAHQPGAAPTDGPRIRAAGRVANGHTRAT
ncbi:LAG1 longevity assurance 4-like protein [Camelus ferus]|nr:LAG1 longevity assurance 4-like protein [Camelus ferus]